MKISAQAGRRRAGLVASPMSVMLFKIGALAWSRRAGYRAEPKPALQ